MLKWLPEDVSPYGAGIDSLFYFIYYLTAVAFIFVTALMIVFLYVYRDQGGRRATYTHGNTALEIIWTIIPAMVFIGLGLFSKSLWEDIKLTPPETDTAVKVTGKQFNWEVVYPGPDGEFDTADDKQVDNDIRVPAGKPIRVILASKDVIHSFFLPNLRFKQDTVPGREITGWFQANKPGKYEIPCAELCGFGHSGMVGWLYALAPDEYQAWQAEEWPQTASANDTPSPAATATAEASPSAAPDESPASEAEPDVAAAPETNQGTTENAQATVDVAAETAQQTAETIQETGTSAAAAVQNAAEEAQVTATEAVQETVSIAQEAEQATTEAPQDATETAATAQETAGETTQATQNTSPETVSGTMEDTLDSPQEAVQDAVEATQTPPAPTPPDTAPTTTEESAGAAEGNADAAQGATDTPPGTPETVEDTAPTSATGQETSAAAAEIDQTVHAYISTSTPLTASDASQEVPAEGSSAKASTSASDQDSSAGTSSGVSSIETASDSAPKYTFIPTAEPNGICQGELEIMSGSTIYGLAQEFYQETTILLGVDLIQDYNTHIANLDHIYPGQKLCIPNLSRTTRLRQSKDENSYNLILDSFRSTKKAKALIRQVQQKGYQALLTNRQVSDSLLLKRVEITGLQNQTAANQAWTVFAPANTEDLS